MASVSVPISETSHKILIELASRGGEPINIIVDRAIEEYRRQQLLDQANVAYSELRAHEPAWQQELDERRHWDATLADGLDEA